MITFLATIFVLGILIIIHELGHFWAARALGITAEKFSFGFGPKLTGFKRGSTEYLISLVPFGGYVKLKGEDPGHGLDMAPDSFSSRGPIQKSLVVFAGPLMNLLLPFIFMPLIFLIGISVPFYDNNPPVIGRVVSDMSAEKAGLKQNDVILKLDGKSLERWADLQKAILLNPGKELHLSVQRNKEILEIALVPEKDSQTGAGYVGILPKIPPVIQVVRKGGPAEKSGFMPGDVIIEINSTVIHQWADVSESIKASEGRELEFTVGRKDGVHKLKVKPEFNKELGYYAIGIEPGVTVTRRHGPIAALIEGTKYNIELFATTFVIFKKLFTFQISFKSLGGPITIAAVSGEAARMGFSRLMEFVAFLSIQLGIINLIPFIPVLDGALIVMLLYEMVRGKEVNIRVKEVFQQVGIFLIILLIILVTYNDINRLWGDDIVRLFQKIVGKFN